MRHSEEQRRNGAQAKRLGGWHSVGILALFVAIGPLVGAVVVFAWIGIAQALVAVFSGQIAQAAEMVAFAVSFGVLFTLPLAYAMGIVPALAVGLCVLWWHKRSRRLSTPVAMFAALVFWVGLVVFRGVSIDAAWDNWIGAGSSLSALLVSAWACTRLARRLF